jgi:hypothetical protein
MRILALAVVLAAAPAAADDAVPVQVTATLHATTARFSIHLAAQTAAAFPAASLSIALPARGLVTAATVTVAGTAHPLALTTADAASDAFYALGTGTRDRWAALVAGSAGSVSIDVEAPERRTLAIDLTVDAPTCFDHDHRYAEVPSTWKARIATVRAPEACELQGPAVAFASPPPEHLGTIAGRLALSTDHMARVELDLARELTDLPADLHTAIVIDASRSLTPLERDEQRAIVASYLHDVPHTSVQLVGYSRACAPMLADWTPSDSAAATIDRALRRLRPANGSNLDAGLAEAGAWLARTTGTRRVIVFTDERLSRRLQTIDPGDLVSYVPAGTLVHVIALTDITGALQRDDTIHFGPLATATGGIGVRGATAASIDATLLARPISLDDVAVTGEGWTGLDLGTGCAGSLPAGTSCTWWARGDASSGPVTLTGSLWNQHVTLVVRPDATHALSVARELVAIGVPDAALQAEIERAALAVDDAWSLLAQWGGHGGYPSPDELGTLSGIGGGHSADTIVDTIGVATVVPQVDLRSQLSGALARCGSVHASIEIELTRDEIVDVHVAGATGAERTCVEDAIWNTPVTVPGTPAASRCTLVL